MLAAPSPITVVDLRLSTTVATKLAVLTCAGLFNRDETVAGAAYTIGADGHLPNPGGGGNDLAWFNDTVGPLPAFTPVDAFLDTCLSKVAKGYIRYNATENQLVMPNIITLAGVLDAVPLETPPTVVNVPLALDASATFAGATSLSATKWVYDRFVNQTSGLAKLNPGFDVHGAHKLNPPLTQPPHVMLADYAVKQRLFTFWLEQGCVPLTAEHAFMETLVTANPWPRPLVVYGYDDTLALAGDLFEAETDCTRQHNMGQVASLLSNLGFFSREPAITAPLAQNPEPSTAPYNASKTYLTVVLGDGDNVAFIKGSRRDWFEQRQAKCAAATPAAARAATAAAANDRSNCFPLAWTMSPQTLHLAPAWLRWYFAGAAKTGRDWFVLPPSGDTYSYPSMMPDEARAAFVAATERDATLLGANASVTWEFAGFWERAIKTYLPNYAARGLVRGFFAVNVPYLAPALAFAGHETYKIISGGGSAAAGVEEKDDDDEAKAKAKKSGVVLFKPREWRGGNGGNRYELSAADMAAEVSGYARGTVAHLYVTSDGGADLDLVYEMVRQLAPHVEVVTPNRLIAMALQRG